MRRKHADRCEAAVTPDEESNGNAQLSGSSIQVTSQSVALELKRVLDNAPTPHNGAFIDHLRALRLQYLELLPHRRSKKQTELLLRVRRVIDAWENIEDCRSFPKPRKVRCGESVGLKPSFFVDNKIMRS